MSHPAIYLQHIPKHSGGARLLNAHTFQASCSTEDKSSATAWLQATKTLKEPEEAAYDEFVHGMEGLMKSTKVIIKLQAVSRLSEREAQVAEQFRKNPQNNVAIPICEFKCRHDILQWKKPIRMRTPFCNGSDTLMSVFVMEYIPHHLTEIPPPPADILHAILKQLGYTLLELHYEQGLTHGDIGSGNMLLDIDTPKTNTYHIAGQTRTVDTHGYEPILIDFQRSVKYKGAPDAAFAASEIAMAYDILSHWWKIPMDTLQEKLDVVETVADLLATIDAI